jgi:hypothetical protein
LAKPLVHQLPTDNCQLPPDLAAVVATWPTLPEAIQAGILAMVRAAAVLPARRDSDKTDGTPVEGGGG